MKTDFKRPFTIDVSDRNGAYNTCSVNGQRASSTHSAKAAAERLATKLLGEGKFTVQQIGWAGIYWEITPQQQGQEASHV